MVKGNHHSLTTRQLDAIFKFPTKLGICQNFNKDELLDLWLTIAGPSPYTSARSKSYATRSHVLRYLHLCILNTFFPTKTTSHINENELGMLDLSLCFILGYTKSGLEMVGDRSDTSFFVVLIDHLMSYREYATRIHQSGLVGTLCVGGVITPILVAARVKLYVPDVTPNYIDIEYLRRKEFLDRSVPIDLFLFKFKHPKLGPCKLPLPCTSHTIVRIGNNINFEPPLIHIS